MQLSASYESLPDIDIPVDEEVLVFDEAKDIKPHRRVRHRKPLLIRSGRHLPHPHKNRKRLITGISIALFVLMVFVFYLISGTQGYSGLTVDSLIDGQSVAYDKKTGKFNFVSSNWTYSQPDDCPMTFKLRTLVCPDILYIVANVTNIYPMERKFELEVNFVPLGKENISIVEIFDLTKTPGQYSTGNSILLDKDMTLYFQQSQLNVSVILITKG